METSISIGDDLSGDMAAPGLEFYGSVPGGVGSGSMSTGGGGGGVGGFYGGDHMQGFGQHEASSGGAGSFYPSSAPSAFDVGGSIGSGKMLGGGFVSFDDEPPLLEELGVNFLHIKQKTMSVLHPMTAVDPHIMDDTDLAGPLIFCLLLGAFLLASGKVHFGYIYGVAVMGCLGMYLVLGMMSDRGISLSQTASVLGYSLLPMVALSCVSVLVSLKGFVGLILAVASVLWCAYSSTRLFVAVLTMDHQFLLVAYPCVLLFGVFALLTVF
eukprot:m.52751 g.52751  ORF g.52751 m.52751 type:complete len:269 (-) comp13100_c0_seq1:293-1099(-)